MERPAMNEQAIEAVARAIYPTAWGVDAPIPTRADTQEFHARRQQSSITAQAALTAYHAWLEANGFAVVPVEPSEAMVEAGWLEIERYPPCQVYRAMIAASKGEG